MTDITRTLMRTRHFLFQEDLPFPEWLVSYPSPSFTYYREYQDLGDDWEAIEKLPREELLKHVTHQRQAEFIREELIAAYKLRNEHFRKRDYYIDLCGMLQTLIRTLEESADPDDKVMLAELKPFLDDSNVKREATKAV